MTEHDSATPIASYEEYLTTYFPQRTSSPLSHSRTPREMGVQLAVESLEKHEGVLRQAVEAKHTAEQGG